MKNIGICIAVFGAIALAGCSSSGSSSTPSPSDVLQGNWAGACFGDSADDSSNRVEFAVSGNSFTQSVVIFINNQTCDGPLSVNQNQHGNFAIPGPVTELPDGDANHVDITYINGTVTASQGFLDFLEAGGTNLQDFMAAAGVSGDITNLSLAEIGRSQAELYTLYRVDTNASGGTEVRLGSTSGTYDGSTPELRSITLSTDTVLSKL